MRSPTDQERELLDAVSVDTLMASTRTIAQWVRLSGSDEERAAFDWIESTLREYGVSTQRYTFPSLVSWPLSANLQVGGEDLACATHAFATPTPPGGLDAEVVYVGRGTEEELHRNAVTGKIALVDGIIAPNRNLVVEAAGVVGSIWIAGQQLHERILSPVWGTPTPETAHLLPKTPSVSVPGQVGARMKQELARGPLRAHLRTEVFRGWNQLPCLVANVQAPSGPEADTFVMFSGHVDSWYHGAMDNGTANATMIEMARLFASRRYALHRGLRLCFWSGHSHGRYSGSTWYADNFWQELHDHCVAHVNVDSVGGSGATVLSEGNSMAEMRRFASEAIEQVTGQRLSRRRYGRAGDQSFWGHGLPSLFMSLSEQPAEAADPVLAALHHQISGGQGAGGGLGWWWHTPEDTVDKIDPDFLRRDAKVYALVLHRLLTDAVLPLDYRDVINELDEAVSALVAEGGEHFDLAPARQALAGLRTALSQLYERLGTPGGASPAAINRCLMRVGRALIPVDYTRSGRYDHDLAVPTQPVPGLQDAARLAALTTDLDAYEFLRTRLTRERNRLVDALTTARSAVEDVVG